MTDLWLKDLNKGETTGVIYLDFSKAFDLIGHDLLFKKIELYKLDDNAIKLFSSYLSNREQGCPLALLTLDSNILLVESTGFNLRTHFIPSIYQ